MGTYYNNKVLVRSFLNIINNDDVQETVDKAVEPDGRSVKSKSKSGSKNKIVTPPTGIVVESNGRKSAQVRF